MQSRTLYCPRRHRFLCKTTYLQSSITTKSADTFIPYILLRSQGSWISLHIVNPVFFSPARSIYTPEGYDLFRHKHNVPGLNHQRHPEEWRNLSFFHQICCSIQAAENNREQKHNRESCLVLFISDSENDDKGQTLIILHLFNIMSFENFMGGGRWSIGL